MKKKAALPLIVVVIAVALAIFGVQLPPEIIDRLPPEIVKLLPKADRTPRPDISVAGLPNSPESFSAAKRLLYDEVYKNHQTTFYCGCKYSNRKVDLSSCGVKPRSDAERAGRTEAEHVFPAAQFGNFRQCWREKICTNKKGEKFKGRECCQEVDPVFRAAHNDLHNLFPAVGEINGRRSNYNWGMIPGEKREHGACNIEVDSSIRRAEPPENVMGDIARTMFYMAETYNFRLSDQDIQLYTAWNNMDPVDDWERERNRRIKAIQGKGNPFIER